MRSSGCWPAGQRCRAGIGLSIARTFVEAHGQRIWVDEAPEGGARFCFTLPAKPDILEETALVAGAHR
jgi:signal transduction histidine kinase